MSTQPRVQTKIENGAIQMIKGTRADAGEVIYLSKTHSTNSSYDERGDRPSIHSSSNRWDLTTALLGLKRRCDYAQDRGRRSKC